MCSYYLVQNRNKQIVAESWRMREVLKTVYGVHKGNLLRCYPLWSTLKYSMSFLGFKQTHWNKVTWVEKSRLILCASLPVFIHTYMFVLVRPAMLLVKYYYLSDFHIQWFNYRTFHNTKRCVCMYLNVLVYWCFTKYIWFCVFLLILGYCSNKNKLRNASKQHKGTKIWFLHYIQVYNFNFWYWKTVLLKNKMCRHVV